MSNTIPLKTVYKAEYQRTHYKEAVYPMFADEQLRDELTKGQSVVWSYDSDTSVGTLGTDNSYTISSKTVTDETLTVNQTPDVANFLKATDRIQDHRPTQEKWAQKQMNKVFIWLDGQILGAMQAAAASTLDAGDFGGSAGTPVTISSSNAPAIYTAARRKLKNQNVMYNRNKKYTGNIKLDNFGDLMPVAAIPAELEEQLLQAIGFKPGDLGDQVLKNGYMDLLFGFNTFTSNNLPSTATYTQTATPTNTDTVVIGGVTFTFVTGSPTNAGDVLAITSASVSMQYLKAAINAPYTFVDGYFKNFTFGTAATDSILGMISATGSGAALVIKVLGNSAISWTATGSGMAITLKAVHALFGTSKSIAVVLQREPGLALSAGDLLVNGVTGGYIGKHLVTWALAGWKVFKTQTYQIVDVVIDSSAFTAPNNVAL